jgi:hypothetical protein
LKIPKEKPEAVNLRMTDNTMTKNKKDNSTSNDLQSITHETKD